MRISTIAASISGILVSSLLLSCSGTSSEAKTDFTKDVDVLIGAGGHGHVFVGANVPFGMVQLGPASIPQTWDWCSGYHASDSTVIGFAHTHLSGTGCGDLLDIEVMPVTGTDLTYSRGVESDQNSGIWSYADRTTEVAVPGYYKVRLMRYPVLAEMTATARVGLSRFTFDDGAADAAIVFDLEDGQLDQVTSAELKVVDDTHIVGFRHSKGWANDQKLWFSAEFSKPFKASSAHGESGLFYRFDFDDPGEVMLKVSVSPVSSEKATANIKAELPGWDFEATAKAASDAWNAELSKVEIKTSDETARKIFYTALYHSMISPALYSDYGDPNRYTTLSLWDTYRAEMPLFTIMHSEKMNDMMDTFIDIYEKEGKLPVWHLWGCETWCMIGNPGAIVLADAITKGFCSTKSEKAWEALKVSSMREDRGQGDRMKLGYIPCDRLIASVAYDTEYAVADWAVAQAAKKLGKEEDYEYFLDRSTWWRKHFDQETGFVRGIMSDGSFHEPFNPYFSNHNQDDYCEGNAWQYTWLAPQDLDGMIELWGGKDNMIQALDSLFKADSRLDGENASADISGMIGQYVHGNEPSHHIVYLYSMAGERERTADLVRKIDKELYFADPTGVCGNEDAGQMSAWYILSSMGFYQAEPAGGRYYFGSPLFDEVRINLPEGKTFTIIAKNNSDENRYIRSITLDGKPYDLPYIDYSAIMAGGTLEFTMGN